MLYIGRSPRPLPMHCRIQILAALSALVLVLGSLPARAYNFLHFSPSAKAPVGWEPGTTIRYFLDPGAGDEDIEILKILLEESMAIWERVPDVMVPRFEFAGYLPEDVTGENYPNYVSKQICFTTDLSACATEYQKRLETVVIFDHDQSILQDGFCTMADCAAVGGPTVFDFEEMETGTFRQGHLIFGSYSWDNPSITAAVMIHEIGHLLGLAHPVINQQLALFYTGNDLLDYYDVFAATMDTNFLYGSVNSEHNPHGHSAAANLNPDDMAGLQAIYPAASFMDNYATIRGVVSKSDENPMTYAVVTAREISDPWCKAYSVITGRTCDLGSTSLCEEYGKASGEFELKGLPPGSYIVSIEGIPSSNQEYYQTVAPGLFDAPFAGNAEFWNEGDAAIEDPLLATTITLVAGEERDINIVLDGTTPIESDVSNPFPELVPPEAIGPAGQTICTLSDKDWYGVIGRSAPSNSSNSSGGCSLIPR